MADSFFCFFGGNGETQRTMKRNKVNSCLSGKVYLLSLEKESSKETSKRTKKSKRQKPTHYGNKPENEQVHFRVFPALAGADSAAGHCPATFAL